MSTKGRSVQATTNLGTDGDHRMRVDNRYSEMSDLKKKLESLLGLCNAFFLATAVLAYYIITTNDNKIEMFPVPIWMSAAVTFQFIARYGMKSNSAAALVAYSTLAGVAGAGFLYFGVGRTTTIIEMTSANLINTILLGVNLFGSAVHIACVFIARKLVNLMQVRKAPYKKKQQSSAIAVEEMEMSK